MFFTRLIKMIENLNYIFKFNNKLDYLHYEKTIVK